MTTTPSLYLEKQGIDLASTRRQMIYGGVLIFAVCLVEYWHFLTGGGLVRWAAVFLLFANALVVSLITLELTGQSGNRLRAISPIWAGLLFAAYPLHTEVLFCHFLDQLGAVFYFSSLWSFLRYQLLWEKSYLAWSVGLAAAAGLASDFSITLPLTIMIAGLLLPGFPKGDPKTASGKKNLFSCYQTAFADTWPFWVAVGATASLHWLAPQLTAYPPGVSDGLLTRVSTSTFWGEFFLNPLRFSFLPFIESQHTPRMLAPVLECTTGLIVIIAAVRLRLDRSIRSSLLFLAALFALALLPCLYTWQQVLHLAHFHQLLLPSAPLCLILALAAEPNVDAIERQTAMLIAVAGSLLLSLLFLIFSYCLQSNFSVFLSMPPYCV